MVTVFFQNYYATPIIRVLIRVISDLKVTCNYLSDLNEILYNEQLEHGEYWVTIIFQNSYATPVIRLSLRVIRSLVTTYQIYMKFCIATTYFSMRKKRQRKKILKTLKNPFASALSISVIFLSLLTD